MRQHKYIFGLIILLGCFANTVPALAQVCVGKPLAARQTLFAVRAMNPSEGRMLGALAAQRLTIPLTVSASYHRIDREESQPVDLAGFESSLEGTLRDGGSRALAVCPVAGAGYRWQGPQSLTLELGLGVGGTYGQIGALGFAAHVRPKFIQRHVGMFNGSASTAFAFDGGANLLMSRFFIGPLVEKSFRTESYWGIQGGYAF